VYYWFVCTELRVEVKLRCKASVFTSSTSVLSTPRISKTPARELHRGQLKLQHQLDAKPSPFLDLYNIVA
jgi:hypothetical protein